MHHSIILLSILYHILPIPHAGEGMSGCYECGSPEGNEARLCPACNAMRASGLHSFQGQSVLGRPEERKRGVSSFVKKTGILGCLLLALSAVLWSAQPYYRMRLGIATADDLYKVCRDQREILVNRAKDPLGKAVGGGVLEGMCDNVRSVCSTNPSGMECQRYSRVLSELSKKYR